MLKTKEKILLKTTKIPVLYVLHKKSKNPGIPVVLQFDNEKS